MFAMKALKRKNPYVFIGVSLVIPILCAAYCLRIFERPMIPTSGQRFDEFINCVWCVIITMTTVGYGDYFPISTFGRMIGIISCLWGVFIVSIFVVTLNGLLEFTKSEGRAFEALERM